MYRPKLGGNHVVWLLHAIHSQFVEIGSKGRVSSPVLNDNQVSTYMPPRQHVFLAVDNHLTLGQVVKEEIRGVPEVHSHSLELIQVGCWIESV